ncbi:MAG: hypothetical protein WC595_05705, partial [Candidatus Nanoarchaeia archaeon]
ENLELRMVVPGFEVPMTGADQRISVSDSRVNRELLLVIPQGTKPGLYTGKITAYNGESERVSEYFTFNVA